ncbi:MAG: sulfatase [Phycisphaeraceae bacterium]
MPRCRTPLSIAGLFFAVIFTFAFAAPLRAAEKMNVIIILVDDWGWTDAGYAGSKLYETPHMDRLAARGTRFTNAYAACTVCSPTRAAMLTGKYPARTHITDWIHGHNKPNAKLKPPQWTELLPREETTIAEAVKPLGYATVHIGKWHLGDKNEGYPDAHGFDRNLGGYERGQPPSYHAPYRIPTLEEGKPGEYLTDREASEACKFIDANREKPFLLYLPHYCVHTPLQAKKEKVEKYQAKIAKMKEDGTLGKQQHAVYAAMIESLDEALGAIMAKLQETKLAERTVIFLTGDNGGLTLNKATDNSPARAGKGSAYEGGVRVPLVVYWPGVTKPGSVCDEPVITQDIFATAIEITGTTDPRGSAGVDGLSLTPVLKDSSAKLNRDAIYWHYPHYHPGGATPYAAIRARDWKLIEWYEDDRVELYNLIDDIGESKDSAKANPDKAASLTKQLHAWQKSVGAQMPVPNPNHDPSGETAKPDKGKGKNKGKVN